MRSVGYFVLGKGIFFRRQNLDILVLARDHAQVALIDAVAESWWRHQGLGLALCAAPEQPAPDTLRAQRRLLRALNRPEAGGYFIALLTQGLVQSVLTLLEPIFGMLLGSEPSAAD